MAAQKRRAETESGDAPSEGSEGSCREEEEVVDAAKLVEEGSEEKALKEEEAAVEEEEGDEEEEEDEDGEEDDDEECEQRHREDDNGVAEENEDDCESGSSPSMVDGVEEPVFILVKLSDIRKEVQCPICLGIIKKTRTVMECLHRFCRDCIDKSMRLGNNECPACRTHCASRRSLRDDPNYDSLIAALYPDIEKYEEEELTFHEEEKNRNKKIQLSIAATLRRQAEALGKRRPLRNMRRGRNRSYMNFQGSQGSDDEDGLNANDWERDSMLLEEHSVDVRPKRYKRSIPRPSRSMATSDADEGFDGNEAGDRETRSASPGRVGNREMLVWGKGGVRSQTRHGGGGINGKNTKGSRIAKICDYLRNYSDNDNELDVHLTLLPLGDHPALDKPHLCCRPTLTIGHICQFVALQMSVQVDQIEILAKKPHIISQRSDPPALPCKLAPSEDDYQILGSQESLDGLYTCFSSNLGNLVLVYRAKIQS